MTKEKKRIPLQPLSVKERFDIYISQVIAGEKSTYIRSVLARIFEKEGQERARLQRERKEKEMLAQVDVIVQEHHSLEKELSAIPLDELRDFVTSDFDGSKGFNDLGFFGMTINEVSEAFSASKNFLKSKEKLFVEISLRNAMGKYEELRVEINKIWEKDLSKDQRDSLIKDFKEKLYKIRIEFDFETLLLDLSKYLIDKNEDV